MNRISLNSAQIGFLRLLLPAFLLALLPTVILPLLVEIPVWNHSDPSPLRLPFMIAGALVVLYWFPRPIFVLWSALLCAGGAANLLLSITGSVPDYLPMPWDTNHYFNLADVFIAAAIVLTPLLLYRIWQEAR